MTAPRPLSERALREAAQVARQEGVAITVERGPDGAWLYRIAPSVDDGAGTRRREEWQKAFD